MINVSQKRIVRVSDALKSTKEPTRRLVGRARFRRAVYCGLGALVALLIGSTLNGGQAHTVAGRITLDAPPVAFLVLAILCVRSTAAELDDLFRWRGGRTAGSAVRMIVTAVGYVIAVVGALGMLSYPIGHLLLGGAIAGVILGIAAQQSLGNVFAGLVLIVARPFSIGHHIRVRSGALGGEFHGTVLSMSLTYVSIATSSGVLKVPNSGILSAAVGPFRSKEQATDNAHDTKEQRVESRPMV
jgi:small-conductance mechanosensitive channel